VTADAYRPEIERRLDALFDRMLRLSDAELRLIALSWAEANGDDRGLAWDSVRAILDEQGRTDMMDDVRSTLSRWVNSYLTATTVEYGTFLTNPGSGMASADVRREALPPLLDAAAAIVTGDRLERGEAELLLRPVDSITTSLDR
jgi:hypothetical protein